MSERWDVEYRENEAWVRNSWHEDQQTAEFVADGLSKNGVKCRVVEVTREVVYFAKPHPHTEDVADE